MLSWHWIFFINIPFGLVAVVLLKKSLKENFEKKKQSIDYAGIITLSLAVIALLSIFVFDQNSHSHGYPLFAGTALAMVILSMAMPGRKEKRT